MYSPLNESDLVFEFDSFPSTSGNQSTPRPLSEDIAARTRSWKPRLSFRKGSLARFLNGDPPERPQTPDGLCSSPACTPRGQLAFIESTSPQSRSVVRCPSLPNLWTGQQDTLEWDDATPSWVARATSPTSPVDTPVGKSLNVTVSSGPICRICHEGEQLNPLLSLCRCSGTVGLVHVACLERWLSSSSTLCCELCHYRFPVVRNQGSVLEWIRSSGRTASRRALLCDVLCFLLLTPLALAICVFVAKGATKRILEGRLAEASCLLVLGCVLLTGYVFWLSLTLRFHRKLFREWQTKNSRLMIDIERKSRQSSEELADVAALGSAAEYLEAAESTAGFPPFSAF